jgi:hypothetical protein
MKTYPRNQVGIELFGADVGPVAAIAFIAHSMQSMWISRVWLLPRYELDLANSTPSFFTQTEHSQQQGFVV